MIARIKAGLLISAECWFDRNDEQLSWYMLFCREAEILPYSMEVV